MNLVRSAGIAALVFVTACSRLTVENHDRLQAGMSYAEVTQILGTPAKCDQALGLRQCTWGDEQRRITVNFAADRLVLSTASGLR